MAEFTSGDIRTWTNNAEHCRGVSEELNALPIADRAQAAKLIEETNKNDRSADRHLPAVKFTFDTDAGGTEHVVDGQCQKYPDAWLYKGSQDIYEMPSNVSALFVNSWRMAADSLDAAKRFPVEGDK